MWATRCVNCGNIQGFETNNILNYTFRCFTCGKSRKLYKKGALTGYIYRDISPEAIAKIKEKVN